MKLRGIDFGPCIDASGLRGFFGEGYWYHHVPFFKRWYNFEGSTFVSKTTNFDPTVGNMALTSDYRPRQLFPSCIWIDPVRNMALNAIGLSGPGASTIFNEGFWQHRWDINRPFMISIAPEGATPELRIAKFAVFVEFLTRYRRMYKNHQYAFQINLSCPNSKVRPAELMHEAGTYLDMLKDIGVPIVIKVNLLVPLEVVHRIARHPACDAICITNTLPFGELPDKVPWDKWFPHGSPLKKFGGGGLSGAPLFPLLRDRIDLLSMGDFEKPIIAGGGITKPEDVNELVFHGLRRGIDAISLSSIAFLRPWNIVSTIEQSHGLLT